MIPMTLDTDVFVIGGGPAGLAAAVAARRKGFRVMVADCARPPIDKACGEGLMPDGLAALRELGFGIGFTGAFPFRGIRFRDGGVSVDASFPNGWGAGVRRTALHLAMVAAAERAGVDLLWGANVIGISAEGVRLAGRCVTARWIVGADGGNSRARAWTGLGSGGDVLRRFGFRRHYRVAPWSGCMELYWGRDAQLYVTPVGIQEVCVAVVSRNPHLRIDGVLADFPDLSERLGGATYGTAELGSVTASRKLDRVVRGRVALVGDASGSVDAITGEGLCLAFRQALALAEALEREDLSGYQAVHRRLMRRPALMATLLLSFDGRPRLRRSVLNALAAQPAIFEKMLAMHVGALSPVDFAASGLALGWQMLAGRPVLMRRS